MQRVVVLAVAVLVAAATIGWPRPGLSHETLTTTVLFDREIVGILNRHCVMCHVEGGSSFPLTTYEQTWLQRRKIRAAVIARHMPPWAAFSGYGQFANENVMTLRESQFIVSWVEGLGPQNAGTVFTNTADSPARKPEPVRAHIDFGHWQLGEPNLTRRFEAIEIEPQQSNGIQRTVVDLGLTMERRVRAVEYMPGDRRVVRAAFLTVQETGQWIGSWTPWYGFVSLPAGVAFTLPARSHVVAEIHYQHGKEKVVERGTLGLFFEDQPATQTVAAVVPVIDISIDAHGQVAAGARAQRFHAEKVLAADTAVLALRPDVQPGITSVEVAARKPNGGSEILLFARDLPIDWPTPYIFKAPVVLPAGTILGLTAYYANAGTAPMAADVRLTASTYSPRRLLRSTARKR
jgi:hypothetical protein